MIKLYKGIVPYEECKCYVHAEATQEDIDLWNLERGGKILYASEDFTVDIYAFKHECDTHIAVMSAPQEIVVERDDSLTEAILKALKELETGITAAQIDAVRDTVKSHNAERGDDE